MTQPTHLNTVPISFAADVEQDVAIEVRPKSSRTFKAKFVPVSKRPAELALSEADVIAVPSEAANE